jgi:hypothetical protein
VVEFRAFSQECSYVSEVCPKGGDNASVGSLDGRTLQFAEAAKDVKSAIRRADIRSRGMAVVVDYRRGVPVNLIPVPGTKGILDRVTAKRLR